MMEFKNDMILIKDEIEPTQMGYYCVRIIRIIKIEGRTINLKRYEYDMNPGSFFTRPDVDYTITRKELEIISKDYVELNDVFIVNKKNLIRIIMQQSRLVGSLLLDFFS